MEQAVEVTWLQALGAVLTRSHLLQADELAATVDAAVSRLGMQATIFLVDHEQETLRALPVPHRPAPPPVAVDSSLPGRVYALVRPLPAGVDAQDVAWQQRCELLAGLTGHLVNAKMPHGDHLHRMRRSRPMSPAAELLWQQLPPLTSSHDRVVITAILQPCYDVGGDGYDYSVDGSLARVVLVDANRGGLAAGTACGVALAAIRAARRTGAPLSDQARAADAALAEQLGGSQRSRYITAVLAELDLDTGRLSYLNAGHPAPLLLRGAKLLGPLLEGRRRPLGGSGTSADVAEVMLEPGDRLLLHTDGVTDARAADGSRFGVTRLVGLVEQCEADRLPAPETLRRLARAVAAHRDGQPADGAAMLMVEWSAEAAHRTTPGPPHPAT